MSSPRIFLAPAPRRVADILDESDMLRRRSLGELGIHEDGPVTGEVFEDQAAKAASASSIWLVSVALLGAGTVLALPKPRNAA